MSDFMKAQISLEMQLYIALAGLGLLYAIVELGKIGPMLENQISGYKAMEFVDSLNENILSGNSSFAAYLPEGMCNATAEGDYLYTRYGKFVSAARIYIAGSAFCPDNTFARLYLSYNATGGYVMVER